MMCRWFLALAVLSVATDVGKHHFILIQDTWFDSHKERAEWFFFYRYRAIHHCTMPHYCVLFYSLIWWYNGCRFSSHFDISLRKVRVSFSTQGHSELSEISPAHSGSKLSKIILDVWRLKPANLHTHLVARKNQVRKHIIVKSLNRKIIWHIQFKHR